MFKNFQNLSNKQHFFIALMLTIITTLSVEHSNLDLAISQFFYNGNNWLIDHGGTYKFIYYDLPKGTLILLVVYLLLALLFRYIKEIKTATKKNQPLITNFTVFKITNKITTRELVFLVLTMLLIPSIVAIIKNYTHVSCPAYLSIFGGNQPYLTLWQSILSDTGVKCFPASQASVGFALYAFAFVPTLSLYRFRIVLGVTIFAWILGAYKMLIGDHFFSHTLVSMILAWSISGGIAALFFRK